MQTYPVMEHFYTIQGEGFHQGRAAYFIRLGGCDVGCVWCDVKESWDAQKHPQYTTEAILEFLQNNTRINQTSRKPIVVITGGEPLMHPLDELTAAIQEAGFETNMETSGTHPLSGHWNWICLSPKKFKPTLPEMFEQAHELKVVIYHPSDFQWAETLAAQVNNECRLYLQPEWSRKDSITPQIIQYILANPRWELSAQVHKYIDVP
jgi:organic radical activating enzyme